MKNINLKKYKLSNYLKEFAKYVEDNNYTWVLDYPTFEIEIGKVEEQGLVHPQGVKTLTGLELHFRKIYFTGFEDKK